MAGAGGGGASARGWDELLQRSRQLVDGIAADTYFPPVQVPLLATAAWHATAAAAAAAVPCLCWLRFLAGAPAPSRAMEEQQQWLRSA
eukprot:SM000007S21011  [mRNA]  locus=s7:1300360:1300623:- [translate_table: standard]